MTSYRGGTTNHTKPASANDDGSTGWYHFAASYNGSTLETSLYKKLDGALDEQSSQATATTAFSEGQIVFGEQVNVLTDSDNLDGILGKDGISKLTAETSTLLNQQKNLAKTMESMAPLVKNAKEML